MTKSQITKIVSGIRFPKSNIYFEKCSADGYAFFGYARKFLDMSCNDCFKKIINRNFSLGAANKIRKVKLSAENIYIYTLWTCAEFLFVLKRFDILEKFREYIDGIGQYENGMFRYCKEECYYVVPNATSAAALLYGHLGVHDKSKELIDILRSEQLYNGNWQYYILNKHEKFRIRRRFKEEDSYHLSMIIYHLRELERLYKIDTLDIVEKSLVRLSKINDFVIKTPSVGWSFPMLYLATKGIDNKLSKKALERMLGLSINNSNFRVRAISAWALVKGELEWSGT